jgi:hypothetical protein
MSPGWQALTHLTVVGRGRVDCAASGENCRARCVRCLCLRSLPVITSSPSEHSPTDAGVGALAPKSGGCRGAVAASGAQPPKREAQTLQGLSQSLHGSGLAPSGDGRGRPDARREGRQRG